MERFHIIVIIVAIVVLCLVLLVVGILLGKGNPNLAFPPSYGECPDYWAMTEDSSKCIIPTYKPDAVNIGSVYDENGGFNPSVMTTPGYSSEEKDAVITRYIDFTDNKWTGICDKQKWAKEYGIVWDGVSNYNNC